MRIQVFFESQTRIRFLFIDRVRIRFILDGRMLSMNNSGSGSVTFLYPNDISIILTFISKENILIRSGSGFFRGSDPDPGKTTSRSASLVRKQEIIFGRARNANYWSAWLKKWFQLDFQKNNANTCLQQSDNSCLVKRHSSSLITSFEGRT